MMDEAEQGIEKRVTGVKLGTHEHTRSGWELEGECQCLLC